MKFRFQSAEFVTSSLKSEHFPTLRAISGKVLPEIAVCGRSNVGKSSLINHLLNTSKLARVSSTPGKTQTLNFFTVDHQVALVDLPGYGYAKVARDVRAQWGEGIESYFVNRQPLQVVLLLLDIRRLPYEEDLAMAHWSAYHKKPLVVVFTKTDKVSKSDREKKSLQALSILEKIPDLQNLQCVLYSVKDPQARPQLIKTINDVLHL